MMFRAVSRRLGEYYTKEVLQVNCRHKLSTYHYNTSKYRLRLFGCGLAALGTAGFIGCKAYYKKQTVSLCAEASKTDIISAGKFKHGLPQYTQDQVMQHSSKEAGIWVTFKHGVYDITEFVEVHPGGKDKVILSAGGSLEPFWDLYDMHKTEHVYEWLEKYRIGNYADVGRDKKRDVNDPFVNDPVRHPAMRINSKKPFNAEPPPQIAIDSFITPNELFFVRNHLPVPEIDPEKYRLEVKGDGIRRPISLTLNDLKTKFKKHTMFATLQCGGNRRSFMSQERPVKGLSWGSVALSNAEWSGVLLKDVLNYAGLKEGDPMVKHIQFEGYDREPKGKSFGASIPVYKAWDKVLLAYEMNGHDLPRDHGFPVRVVAPGVIGVRNVKWLASIIPSNEESHSHAQRNDYMVFNPSIDWSNVDFTKGTSIQDVPVTSAILDPLPGTNIDADLDDVTLRGYAWSGGGRGIIRVDVSADGGKTWHNAELQRPPNQELHQTYAWTLWEATVPLPKNVKETELICKAVDNSYNVQPETSIGIWNMRGLLNNSWHRVKLPVVSED